MATRKVRTNLVSYMETVLNRNGVAYEIEKKCDEDYSFIYSKDFAELIQKSSNYYVLITRQPLYNLPYSIQEIYGIRTTGKYHYPEKIYHEFYQIYDNLKITKK